MRTAHRLELRRGISLLGIHVDMRTKRQHIQFFVAASTQRDDLEAHPAGVLNRHVPEAADAQHGNRIASLRTRLLQGVEGGDACAEDRGSLFGVQRIGDGHQTGGPDAA